jgi:hypothetical protein
MMPPVGMSGARVSEPAGGLSSGSISESSFLFTIAILHFVCVTRWGYPAAKYTAVLVT